MSQYSIQQSLGNASGVAVSPINADATLSTGVALNSSLWAYWRICAWQAVYCSCGY
ncbi:TPA: hypothetical protein PPI76_002980 [Escherichia coli]|nr:hypothetical protein [Escherichia coli]